MFQTIIYFRGAVFGQKDRFSARHNITGINTIVTTVILVQGDPFGFWGKTHFEAFLVAGWSDSFENGFYLSYMIVLIELIRNRCFSPVQIWGSTFEGLSTFIFQQYVFAIFRLKIQKLLHFFYLRCLNILYTGYNTTGPNHSSQFHISAWVRVTLRNMFKSTIFRTKYKTFAKTIFFANLIISLVVTITRVDIWHIVKLKINETWNCWSYHIKGSKEEKKISL